jgi:hypothetical protein
LRKFALLVAGVALSVGTLAACVGGPPAPPPTDPHDVLVVGASVSFSFGCVLGDTLPGVSPNEWNCPARSGYSTKNMAIGACTIWPSQVLLYNTGTAQTPNCDTVAAGPDNLTWEQAADYYTPKVVVIDTSGWEVVDRWVSDFSGAPDARWGDPGCSPNNVCSQAYQTAAVQYSSALYDAINVFRSRGAKVVIASSPYFAPPEPLPDPNGAPAGLGCSYWEPYPNTPPTATGGHCTGNATAGSGGTWRSPYPGLAYRSSRVKVDQFNDIITLVKNQYFGSDPNVLIFPFKQHFNGPGGAYTDYVCPPPNDRTVAPDPITHKCLLTNPPGLVDGILARAPDKGHLSTGGAFDVLQPYLEPCVKSLIPVAGGDPSACS